MKKEHVKLKNEDKELIFQKLQKGEEKARVYKRMMSLLELDKGLSYEKASKISLLSSRTLRRLAFRYRTEGISCLGEYRRTGRPVESSSKLEDKIILLACSEAPKGYSQWSLRLLAEKVVSLGYIEKISHTQVFNILKKRKLSHT